MVDERRTPGHPTRRRRLVWAVGGCVALLAATGAWWLGSGERECFQQASLGFFDEPTYDPWELAGGGHEPLAADAEGPERGERDTPGTYTWTSGDTTWELTVERGTSTGTTWQYGPPEVCRPT